MTQTQLLVEMSKGNGARVWNEGYYHSKDVFFRAYLETRRVFDNGGYHLERIDSILAQTVFALENRGLVRPTVDNGYEVLLSGRPVYYRLTEAGKTAVETITKGP